MEIQEGTHSLFLLQSSKYYQLASALILFYDYIITFDTEVETIWTDRKRTLAKLLFFLNRYFPLLFYSWVLREYHRHIYASSKECTTFIHFPLIFVTISESIIIAMITQRIYAIYLYNRYVLVFLISLGSIQIILDVATVFNVISLETSSPQGCIMTIKHNSYTLFAVLWAWNVILDSSVLALTLYRTLWFRRKTKTSSSGLSLMDLLFRDGLIYFIVMFSAKLMNFIMFTRISRDLITVNWTFNHVITVIMVSRIFLNVRLEGVRERGTMVSTSASASTSLGTSTETSASTPTGTGMGTAKSGVPYRSFSG